MRRECIRCGLMMHEIWRADEAIGKADIWCVSCGTGHKVDRCVLRAVTSLPRGRWVEIPEGTMMVGGEEEA